MESGASDVCIGTLRLSYIYQTHAGQQLGGWTMTKTRTNSVVDCNIDFTPRQTTSLVRFMVAHALSHLEDHMLKGFHLSWYDHSSKRGHHRSEILPVTHQRPTCLNRGSITR
jgi:hypothetical protein